MGALLKKWGIFLMLIGLFSPNVYAADCKDKVELDSPGWREPYVLCEKGKIIVKVNTSNNVIDDYIMARAVDADKRKTPIQVGIKVGSGEQIHIGSTPKMAVNADLIQDGAGRSQWWIFFPDKHDAAIFTGDVNIHGPYYIEYMNEAPFPIQFGHCMYFEEGACSK